MKNLPRITGLIFVLLCVIISGGCATQKAGRQSEPVTEELRLQGWMIWGNGLEAAAQGNTVILNGKVADAAGYMSIHLDTALKNKTVILEVQNAEDSVFSEDRMLKITVNREDRLIYPANVNVLIYGEYVSAAHNRIEFITPGDFDGKMNLVFFQADLNDLKITAYYK